MARYIDADKIDFSPLKDDFDRARAKVIIMGQPTADVVEVKHGEWEGLECNLCGHFATYANDYNYCPECGAKMDGGKAE